VLSPSQKRSLLAGQELFQKLSDRELDDLVRSVHAKHVAAREELCHKDDPGNQLFLIVEGKLKAHATSIAGQDVVFSIMGPGEMFGEMAIFCGGRRTANVIAIEDCELLVIDRRELFPFLRRHPDAAIKLLEVLALRVQHLTKIVEDLSRNLPQRLAKRLLDLATRYGKPTPEGLRIEMKTNQSELGELVSTTRESINKQFRAWNEERVVSMSGGFVTILDEERLRDIAEEE
jgi:CRP/FNR family cyclic AMP-dependent transcriptional regulator